MGYPFPSLRIKSGGFLALCRNHSRTQARNETISAGDALFLRNQNDDTMTRKELTDIIASNIQGVIDNPGRWGEDPQLSIIPTTLLIGIERRADADTAIAYSDYAIEEDAVEDGDYSEDAADFQSASDPDLYPISLLTDHAAGKPDLKKIAKLVERYIPEKEENLYAE